MNLTSIVRFSLESDYASKVTNQVRDALTKDGPFTKGKETGFYRASAKPATEVLKALTAMNDLLHLNQDQIDHVFITIVRE